MLRVNNLCEDSDDDGEWSNTNAASVPPLLVSRKRPRKNEESSKNGAYHPSNENHPGNRNDRSANEYSQSPSSSEPPSNASGRKSNSPWEFRFSELSDYRKIHGNCNVPQHYSENAKLGSWVKTQRTQYKLHREGKISSLTPYRLQALESLGFKWNMKCSVWEVRLSELADYCKIHGHCNVPYNYSENAKLATWVSNQRQQYNSNLNGETSPMTTFRIQELESLGFEWKPSRGHGKRTPKKSSVDDDATCVCERAVEAPEHVQTTAQNQKDFSGRELPSNQIDVAGEAEESDWNNEVHLGYIPGRTEEI
jgi:hypothetical protein